MLLNHHLKIFFEEGTKRKIKWLEKIQQEASSWYHFIKRTLKDFNIIEKHQGLFYIHDRDEQITQDLIAKFEKRNLQEMDKIHRMINQKIFCLDQK